MRSREAGACAGLSRSRAQRQSAITPARRESKPRVAGERRLRRSGSAALRAEVGTARRAARWSGQLLVVRAAVETQKLDGLAIAHRRTEPDWVVASVSARSARCRTPCPRRVAA